MEQGVASESGDALLTGTDHLLVTATWTIAEVTSALVQATRVGRQGDVDALLAVLAGDTGEDGTVTLLRAGRNRCNAVQWRSSVTMPCGR